MTVGGGVVELPNGARIRGRSLRSSPPADPDWGLYLLGKPPPETAWPRRWLRWPDFWLPMSFDDARSAFAEAHERAVAGERVEVACQGGIGRTGTALACIAQLGGVSSHEATLWVRAHYHRRAVETPWQRWYVRHYARPISDGS